jgi:hypothetical protein
MKPDFDPAWKLPPVTNSVPLPTSDKQSPPVAQDLAAVRDGETQCWCWRRVWQESISFLSSTLVHLVLLVCLSLLQIYSSSRGERSMVLIPTHIDDETPLDVWELKSIEVSAGVQSFAEAASLGASAMPANADNADPQLPVKLVEFGTMSIATTATNFAGLPDIVELESTAGIREAGGQSVIAEGRSSLRQSASPHDAVSGLGGDIARRLETGDVLVVWMFDASLSMREDRTLAAQQMTRVFRELDERTSNQAYHHWECLVGFGQQFAQLAPPTQKWSLVTKAAANMPNDVTGVENVFTALQYAIVEHRKQWPGQLLYLIWTDESGNDVQQLEQTIELCRKHNVSVSVVGPTAVLGRPRGMQFFRLNPQYAWWLDVDKGPDAAVLQLVQLPHWFGGPQANAMPSGFGPYALVRLSQQTGGSFTLYDRVAERSRYRLEALSDYLPDYRDAATVERDARQSSLRRAVLEAAQITARAGDRGPPTLAPDFTYWYSPAEYQPKFAAVVAADLDYVRRGSPLIEDALTILSEPYSEVELQREASPRWKANYLLARGRLLALSVRHREYEILATALLQGKVFAPATNDARIEAAQQLRSGDWGSQRRDEARRWLQRCAAEHQQTPWGDLAAMELNYPFGLNVVQRVTVPAGVAGPTPASPTPPRL